VVAIVAAACGTGATPSPSASASAPAVSAPASAPAASGSQAAAGKQWKIGYSNGGGVGNGFREEQVCTAKAEALASGQVSQLTTIHRNTDAAGQLQDIRDLIAAGVDAIVFNPNDPAALNPALEEAKAAGIKTVAVDQFVTNPDTYQLFNNQVKYAELGAKWLFTSSAAR
jgi:ribose transport system substrate-binding protein